MLGIFGCNSAARFCCSVLAVPVSTVRISVPSLPDIAGDGSNESVDRHPGCSELLSSTCLHDVARGWVVLTAFAILVMAQLHFCTVLARTIEGLATGQGPAG